LCFEADEEDDDDTRRVALRHCLSRLPERQMRILRQRYWSDESIRSIAQTERKSESSIKMALMRVRRALLACIQDQLGPQGSWRAEA
jgi:RNA polymerase sigma-70 factor (ECF subfamily)